MGESRNFRVAARVEDHGQNPEVQEGVRSDLEQAAGIGKLVNLVQDQDGRLHRAQKSFGICDAIGAAGEIAAQVHGPV